MYNEIIKNTKRIYNNSNKNNDYIELTETIFYIHKEIGEALNKFKTIYKTKEFYENETFISSKYAEKINILKERLMINYKTLTLYDRIINNKNYNELENIINEEVNDNNKNKDLLLDFTKELFNNNKIIELSRLIALYKNIYVLKEEIENSKVVYSYKEVLDKDNNIEIVKDPRIIKIIISNDLDKNNYNNELKKRFVDIIEKEKNIANKLR